MRWIAALPVLAMSLSSASYATPPMTLSEQDRSDLAITLYTDNLGFVQDIRSTPILPAGQVVHLTDVSRQMEVESLQIRNAGQIKEQTLSHATLNYATLLQQHIGKEVLLANESKAAEPTPAILLSIDQNTALVNINQRIETIPLNGNWRIIFPTLPENMLLQPSLTFKTDGTSSAQQSSISYLTQGLSWKMDYVATLSEDGSSLLFDGLASMNNQTGTDFKDARIRLLAGNVNQNSPQHYRGKALMMAASAESDNAIQPEALSDYQLYTLPHQVSLADQQQTQVSLIHADNVKVNSVLRYRFYIHGGVDQLQQKIKPDTFINFINNQHYGIGTPLPAGQVRFFSPDKKGDLHFVGTDNIGQTAIGEPVELNLGKSFDVTISQKQTDYQSSYDGSVVAYELSIKNSGTSSKEIEISSQFAAPWKLISSSSKPTSESGGEASWKLNLPGKSDTVLSLRVRLTPPKN